MKVIDLMKLSESELRATVGWLRVRSREWNAAWRGLLERSQDRDADSEFRGERWQYLGSDAFAGGWRHHFRHRMHPRLGRDARIRVPATLGWTPAAEQVNRTRRVLH
ncbi:MAG: hypothetical protein IPJ65_10615 [Archangiaceae bacterium]|nr:hypothetical protein [Archangiaceae bacterium]